MPIGSIQLAQQKFAPEVIAVASKGIAETILCCKAPSSTIPYMVYMAETTFHKIDD